jgi:hypothetical protein
MRQGGGDWPAAVRLRRRAAVSGGAKRTWGWGAPISTEKTLGRREVDGELNWVDGGRRRRRRAADGGRARWCKSDDLASVM